MIILNLLEFLNSVKILTALEYAKVDNRLVNFLDLMSEDEQFTYRIDFGVMYLFCSTSEQYTIIDGLNRLLSLSLPIYSDYLREEAQSLMEEYEDNDEE